MHEILSESDLSLIHALQIRPRASWAELAPILHTTPATLARRWTALTERGLAWVTGYPTPQSGPIAFTSMVDVTCRPSGIHRLVDFLGSDPRVSSIEHAARGRDLILTVQTGSLHELSDLILTELPTHESVRSTRTHACAALHAEGSQWRLDALDSAQVAAVSRLQSPIPPAGTPGETLASDVARPLLRQLTFNGRASAREIASAIDRPASSVRRQLATLLRSRAVVLRCDVAQEATRWPIIATWWCRLPMRAHREMAEIVKTRSELRLCMTLIGPANFLVSMWVGSLADLLQIQGWMESRQPGLDIVDSSVTLRTRKRMGWQIDEHGRATGHVTSIS